MLFLKNFFKIRKICKTYNIKYYKILSDGSINVDYDVNLSNFNLTKLPLKFNKVSGYFDCSHNYLNSLEGAPKEVGGNFYCYKNSLTSLKGCPVKICRNFFCSSNFLTSLDGCLNMQIRNKFIDCSRNHLTSLEGCPRGITNINFIGNFITTLKGLPDDVTEAHSCENPIFNIVRLFRDFNEFKSLLEDYNYLRGTRIIKVRFAEACLDANIEIPEKIEGYTII